MKNIPIENRPEFEITRQCGCNIIINMLAIKVNACKEHKGNWRITLYNE